MKTETGIIVLICLLISISVGIPIEVEESAAGFEISWVAPQLDSTIVGDDYLLLGAGGATIDAEPGTPGIPCFSFPVVLPQVGDYDFIVESIRWEPMGKGDLAPAARWGGYPEGPYYRIYERNDSAFSENRWFPENPVGFFDAGFMRNIRIGRFYIHPVRYNPVSRELERLVELEARFEFDVRGAVAPAFPDAIESAIIANSLNPTTGREFVRKKPRRRIETGILSKAETWFTIPVSSPGLLKIDRSYLASLGIDPDEVDPDRIRIFDDGWREMDIGIYSELPDLEEVPLYAVGLGDGSFDSGDALYFYARGPSDWFVNNCGLAFHMHRFTFENRYWLTVAGDFDGDAERLVPETVPPADTVTSGMIMHHIEYDQTYAKTGNDIGWGWERTYLKHISFIDSRLDTSHTVTVSYRNVPVADESCPTPNPTVNGHSPDSTGSLSSGRTGFYNDVFTRGTNSIEISFGGFAVLFDYYEIVYRIELMERNGNLTFAGLNNPATYVFEGFSAEPLVFDITDEVDLRLLSVDNLGGGKYAFSDSAVCRRYYITSTSEAGTPNFGRLENLANLRDRNFGCDLILVIPEGLETDLEEYINFRESRGTSVEWVYIEDILNEFGFGADDPTAIRDFLRYVWLTTDPAPQYVLLVGDATWDPRGITDPSPTHCPAALCVSNAPEDYFYSVTEGDYVRDYAGGRVPVNVKQEWRDWVAKLKEAEGSPDFGPWRIHYVFCADDERVTGNNPDTYTHTNQTSSNSLGLPGWADNDMIYLVDYPITSTGLKPLAREDLIDSWNEGAALVNYIGHGNFRLWSHEEIFEATSCVPRLENKWKLPIVFSASCEVGLFYRTTGQCIAEQVILIPEAGAVASVAATRMTSAGSNGALDNRFIQNCWGNRENTTAGVALSTAKGGTSYSSNDGQYVLFGDPSMSVGPPPLEVVLDAVPDSIIAGNITHITGEVREDSVIRSDFNGTAYILVYDSGFMRTYSSEIISGSVTYYVPGNRLFAGPVDVENGRFEAEFVSPIDISYNTNGGKIVVYAFSKTEEGVGFLDSLPVYGDTSLVITDTLCPEIKLTLEGPGFADLGVLCGGGTLICELYDTNGINISGAAGHTIMMTIDGAEAAAVDLSPYFSYYRNSFTRGRVEYEIGDISPGVHTVRVKAWDNLGNGCAEELLFEVDDCELAISNPLAYPNPFKSETDITFNIDEPAEVTIRIFTLSGRFVREISAPVEPAFAIVRWDGKDRRGTPVANGTYIVKIEARSSSGETVSSIMKIARTR